jgi:hypothetical protein
MMSDIPFWENGAMAKYKRYNQSQNVLIPVSLEGWRGQKPTGRITKIEEFKRLLPRSFFRIVLCSKWSVRISISTSDRNRQNRSWKWQYSSLRESGHRTPPTGESSARTVNRRSPFSKKDQRGTIRPFFRQPATSESAAPWRCHLIII